MMSTALSWNNHSRYREGNSDFRASFGDSLPANGQEPHTLWIGCSDSRVPPELIVGAKPGELFVHRNIGNIVPLPGNGGDCTASVLIYALDHLPSIRDVVICGHSDCGAMKTLLALSCDGLEPELTRWLFQAEPVLDLVLNRSNVSDPVQALAETNVLVQMERLCHYRCVKRRLQTGCLALHGLIYDVANGSLRELA